MPCSDGGLMRTNAVEVARLLREVRGEAPDPYDVYGNVATLDADTAALCGWCRANLDRIPSMSARLQSWWEDHREIDAKRPAR